ncbi:hypothetical protein Pcinc_000592 [Petrolisthes cinctipes]|uniref:Uncharacterized protein n=1 Tax=Petrolisthes cinctipes TaxID=88211 RepID=A0AAE1GPQ3_PETCI|nr:hypothetical protein Pcinc_000592 [Petrolisthes cinctipes]
MIPYYSKFYKSNESENGLWRYIKRTSEVVAEETGMNPVAYQHTHNLGEAVAVLDAVAKRRMVSCCDSSSRFVNRERSKIKERALLKAVGTTTDSNTDDGGAMKIRNPRIGLCELFNHVSLHVPVSSGHSAPFPLWEHHHHVHLLRALNFVL